MNDITIRQGTRCRVYFIPGCLGYEGHPPYLADEGMRMQVTVVNLPGDHSVRGLFKSGLWSTGSRPREVSASAATSAPTGWSGSRSRCENTATVGRARAPGARAAPGSVPGADPALAEQAAVVVALAARGVRRRCAAGAC